ncbi:MAG: hypothetical protein V3U27_05040 [Candidatus Tectomicrobia bacterium]
MSLQRSYDPKRDRPPQAREGEALKVSRQVIAGIGTTILVNEPLTLSERSAAPEIKGPAMQRPV